VENNSKTLYQKIPRDEMIVEEMIVYFSYHV